MMALSEREEESSRIQEGCRCWVDLGVKGLEQVWVLTERERPNSFFSFFSVKRKGNDKRRGLFVGSHLRFVDESIYKQREETREKSMYVRKREGILHRRER